MEVAHFQKRLPTPCLDSVAAEDSEPVAVGSQVQDSEAVGRRAEILQESDGRILSDRQILQESDGHILQESDAQILSNGQILQESDGQILSDEQILQKIDRWIL